MSNDELERKLNKSQCRRYWDRHGSWLLISLVGFLCYGMGAQHAAYNMGKLNLAQAEKIERLTEQNTRLSMTIAPAAQQAAKDASRAAEQVEKAIRNRE